MGSGAFSRPQATTTMAGPTMSTPTSVSTSQTTQPPRSDRGKAIMTQSEIGQTISQRPYNHLSAARKKRLAESLLVIIPGAFEGDDPATAEEFAPTLNKIELLLNKAKKWGYYFGVKPYNSFPPPLSPAIEFDFGVNPRSILFPVFKASEAMNENSETYENTLLLWYALHSQGVKTTFSLFKIIRLSEVRGEDRFLDVVPNFRIKVTRADSKEYFFTLADIPFMNPADLVALITLCSKRKGLLEMEWLIEYFCNFLGYLFRDYAHQDIELGNRLAYEVKKPRDDYIDAAPRENGEIIKDGTRIVGIYFEIISDNGRKERKLLKLEDVGLYDSNTVTNVTSYVQNCRVSAMAKTKKFVLDRLTWIIDWRARMFELAERFCPHVYAEIDQIAIDERIEREGLDGAGSSGAHQGGIIFRED